MKKLKYYISRIFFSRNKILLIRLLNVIEDNVSIVNGKRDKIEKINAYIQQSYGFDMMERIDLVKVIFYDDVHKLENVIPYDFEHVKEFLKELIKKN